MGVTSTPSRVESESLQDEPRIRHVQPCRPDQLQRYIRPDLSPQPISTIHQGLESPGDRAGSDCTTRDDGTPLPLGGKAVGQNRATYRGHIGDGADHHRTIPLDIFRSDHIPGIYHRLFRPAGHRFCPLFFPQYQCHHEFR